MTMHSSGLDVYISAAAMTASERQMDRFHVTD